MQIKPLPGRIFCRLLASLGDMKVALLDKTIDGKRDVERAEVTHTAGDVTDIRPGDIIYFQHKHGGWLNKHGDVQFVRVLYENIMMVEVDDGVKGLQWPAV